MDRQEAERLMRERVRTRNLQNHCLAVEAVMRELARYLGEDEELWGLAGLLHDIDYEETKDDPARHSLVGSAFLAELGLPPEVVYAVKAHNEFHGLERRSNLDRALYASDPLTGLIVAAALVRPEKKLAPVDVPFLLHRFHEKSFARGANRQQIASCAEMGLTLEQFFSLGLQGMKKIAPAIGL